MPHTLRKHFKCATFLPFLPDGSIVVFIFVMMRYFWEPTSSSYTFWKVVDFEDLCRNPIWYGSLYMNGHIICSTKFTLGRQQASDYCWMLVPTYGLDISILWLTWHWLPCQKIFLCNCSLNLKMFKTLELFPGTRPLKHFMELNIVTWN